MTRPEHPVTAYIGLGSNLDGPAAQVTRAMEELDRLPESRVTARSPLYRTRPMGPRDQPDYINAVATLATGLAATGLLEHLQRIEELHGRVRTGPRWGPRTLDLDLLLYGEKTIFGESLTVPHPGLAGRAFVLYPLYDIAPDLALPDGTRLADLLARCPPVEIVRLGNAA